MAIISIRDKRKKGKQQTNNANNIFSAFSAGSCGISKKRLKQLRLVVAESLSLQHVSAHHPEKDAGNKKMLLPAEDKKKRAEEIAKVRCVTQEDKKQAWKSREEKPEILSTQPGMKLALSSF